MAKAAKKHDREIIKDQSPSPEKSVVSYKGFDKNLQCRGFQFEIGKTYTTTENSGVNGTWIGAAEYDETGKCVGIVVGRVGQDGLKENTPYVARGGKFVEAD